MSNPFGTAALLLAENDPFEITFSPLSLILNWPKQRKIIHNKQSIAGLLSVLLSVLHRGV